MSKKYLDLLAYFGIGGAHPGGFSLTQSILENEKIQMNSNVLDIGCGTGQTAAYIFQRFGCHVTAVDNHVIMLEKARERMINTDGSVVVIEGDAQSMELMDDSFDLIVAESVISFTEISRTLDELARVLKSGGRMILIEMTAEQPISGEIQKKVRSLYGINEVLSEQDWIFKLQQAGFSQIERIDTPTEQIQNEITDIIPSETINMDLFDIWDEHTLFMSQCYEVIGFRAFRCQLP